MLSMINFQDHPTNRNMEVFFFKQEIHAAYFERLLNEHNLFYEKQIDTESDQTIYFGVKKTDFKEAKRLNYLTIGHFRKPFIPDVFFRYFIIIISIIVLSLAIIGGIVAN